MTILEHVKQAISEGLAARLATQAGEPGALFLDEHEFIPFGDLNYNSDLGYFKMSLFPDARRECTNPPVVDGRSLNRGTPGRRWAEMERRVTGYVPGAWADELIRLGRNQSDAVRMAVDIALHPFEPVNLDPIRLTDPLECGIRTGDGNCGKPAYAAHVYRWRHPTYEGHYVLLPVCRECAEATMKAQP